MKALIWIVVFLVFSPLMKLIQGNIILHIGGNWYRFGPILVGVLTGALFYGEYRLAKFLCKKWDAYKTKKKINGIILKAAAEGISLKEYIMRDITQEWIDSCENYKGKPEALERYLRTLVTDKKISKDAYIYLYEEYKK